MSLQSLSNDTLTERLQTLSQRDLKLTAEIVLHIHEFMVRRLYLDCGSTSMFCYLVDRLGYPRATAQNRIDAARLLGDVPEIGEDLASGKINLGQISLISMGIRQVEKENPGVSVSAERKRELVEKLKDAKSTEAKKIEGGAQTEANSAQLIAAELNIKINKAERVRFHQDGSVTLEVHLSKEEYAVLKRVREINAHKNHDAKFGETVAETAKFFLEKKDPLKLKTNVAAPEVCTSTIPNPKVSFSSSSNLHEKRLTPRKYLSVHVTRAIQQRDKTCRWVEPGTDRVCGSTFQLQLDHVQGLADGGGNEIENLELKCAVHNRRKFEIERRLI